MTLPLIGALATMPSRAATLARMLEGAAAQVERLFVFLDGFDAVPAEVAANPKCHAVLLGRDAALHASSRFLAPGLFGRDAIVCLFDDDILYPPDYARRLAARLAAHGGRAIVGVHGGLFTPPHERYVRDRRTVRFVDALERESPVHVLGTGTIAFATAAFAPDPRTWRHRGMDDLYVAAHARRAGLPLVAVARPAGWLTRLDGDQPDSIWRATKRDDRVQSELMRYVLSLHAGPVREDWWA